MEAKDKQHLQDPGSQQEEKPCQHHNLNELNIDFDGDGMYRRMECLDCGDRITNYYELVNVFNETRGEEEPISESRNDRSKA